MESPCFNFEIDAFSAIVFGNSSLCLVSIAMPFSPSEPSGQTPHPPLKCVHSFHPTQRMPRCTPYDNVNWKSNVQLFTLGCETKLWSFRAQYLWRAIQSSDIRKSVLHCAMLVLCTAFTSDRNTKVDAVHRISARKMQKYALHCRHCGPTWREHYEPIQ